MKTVVETNEDNGFPRYCPRCTVRPSNRVAMRTHLVLRHDAFMNAKDLQPEASNDTVERCNHCYNLLDESDVRDGRGFSKKRCTCCGKNPRSTRNTQSLGA